MPSLANLAQQMPPEQGETLLLYTARALGWYPVLDRDGGILRIPGFPLPLWEGEDRLVTNSLWDSEMGEEVYEVLHKVVEDPHHQFAVTPDWPEGWLSVFQQLVATLQ